MTTTATDRLEVLRYELLKDETLKGERPIVEAAQYIQHAIDALEAKRRVTQERLGQLHIWVAEARSAKIGFAEYISEKMEEAWEIRPR